MPHSRCVSVQAVVDDRGDAAALGLGLICMGIAAFTCRPAAIRCGLGFHMLHASLIGQIYGRHLAKRPAAGFYRFEARPEKNYKHG
ncbi:hypothetical protein HR08_07870 [Porphyromonas gulae]|uniref:Uncharacterized protein n=1 Tax=Porphyromonas gulae TaxID=111105 RepID=A0A0A2F987_9PORP|nr:hypothetical protein HR08_07870 [Porphyromonas gulae]